MWVSLTCRVTLLCLAATYGTASFGQTVSTSDQAGLNLDTAVARTLESNPRLIAFGYQIQAQQGRLQQSELKPNLEFDLLVENALGSGDFEGIDGAETTLSLGWVLERGKRERRIDAARASISLLETEAQIQRLDAAAETARAFLDTLALQERLIRTEDAVMLAEQTAAAVQKRVQAGRTPAADLARAEAELARMRLDREDIEHELRTAHRRLAAQWGEIQPGFTRVNGDVHQLPVPDAYASLLARLEQNRNQGEISEARARLAMTDADRDATRVQIETQVFALYEELKYSLHRAATIREEILPRIERALEDTERAYAAGRYGYFELRVVQAELLDTRTALVESSIDAHRHVIEIERLTGTTVTSSVTYP